MEIVQIEVIDTQNIKKINRAELVKQLNKVFKYLDIAPGSISFCLCDNDSIRELNRKYLFKDRPTDVIAFPLESANETAYLGEVVVSVEEAVRRGAEFKQSWQKELLLYLVHGILHLKGYNDTTAEAKRIMDARQKEVLGIFGAKAPGV
ncbi:MAG: rRNA maturation RNase YbeY [Candidatus Omnitrophica bacterium]|nr:rRNA maturation RNase YbeY [Candidatus Omnitrophota bacterium]MBD3269605.1 rRNA maturation RNase YbeY [Candidatus Omnitrophota bacterium]